MATSVFFSCSAEKLCTDVAANPSESVPSRTCRKNLAPSRRLIAGAGFKEPFPDSRRGKMKKNLKKDLKDLVFHRYVVASEGRYSLECVAVDSGVYLYLLKYILWELVFNYRTHETVEQGRESLARGVAREVAREHGVEDVMEIMSGRGSVQAMCDLRDKRRAERREEPYDPNLIMFKELMPVMQVAEADATALEGMEQRVKVELWTKSTRVWHPLLFGGLAVTIDTRGMADDVAERKVVEAAQSIVSTFHTLAPEGFALPQP